MHLLLSMLKPIVKKKIKGLEFRDEQLDGFHIIVGKKAGSNPKNAIVYFPGGGSRRWQLPFKSSEKKLYRRNGCRPAAAWGTAYYPKV